MFERLIKLVREEKVSLFIGAGFSIEAHAPSVPMLCKAILSDFGSEEQRKAHENDSLSELSEFYVEEVCSGSRNSLIELMQKQFTFTPDKMDDHKALAKIPHFHNIFATNYDTLLEDSYPNEACQVIRKDADCAYLDNNKPVKIFKIHGDFTNQDFMVITSSDYANYFNHKNNAQMWDVVKHDFLTKHILFIGYSLSDDNIIDIIKNISTSINKNQKEMYLIAPNIDRKKQGQLKAMKVHYFDALASDFFVELEKNLDANISKDFRHHKVTSETFNRYCELHGFNPVIQLNYDKENEILDFHSSNGENLHQSFYMKFDGKTYKDFIENRDFEKGGVILNSSPFPNVPCLKISQEHLRECTHSVNGIVMNDEFSAIYISPEVKDFAMTIRIPTRNFLERVVATIYRARKGKVVIDLDCHIYMLKIEIEEKEKEKDEIGTHLNLNFTFKFKNKYTNNNEAIKWIDLLLAMFLKEDVFIKEISDVPFNTAKGRSDKFGNTFGMCKKYYENIREIEIRTGEVFTEYIACNEDNYNISHIILSYLKHEPVIYSNPKGFFFTVKAKLAKDFVFHVKEDKEVSLVSTAEESKEYYLNGQKFLIPYALKILNQCTVEKIADNHDGNMEIEFHYGHLSYLMLYTNKPVFEEFPELKSLEDPEQHKKAV